MDWGKFIVLEGIDAAGKTTIGLLLNEQLKNMGYTCSMISKKNPIIEDEQANKYCEILGNLVWATVERGIPYEFISETGWCLKLALWFKVLYEVHVKKQLDNNDFVIIDGWYYKLHARFQQNTSLNKILLDSLLQELDIANKVFLLDSDPETCWTRRKIFKNTEIGKFGDEINDAHSGFIEYQQSVYNSLNKMADDSRWTVVKTSLKSPQEITCDLADYIVKN